MNRCIQAHDLLWGMSPHMLPDNVPDWAIQVLLEQKPVVVRRGMTKIHMIPVGIRGEQRNQRFATEMPTQAIIKTVSPESLLAKNLAFFPHLQHKLQQIYTTMQSFALPWGYTGSVGYELATGLKTVNQNSDVDLLIRTEQFISKSEAQIILTALENLGINIDVQLQTPLGGVALKEWARTAGEVLLKQNDKAVLVKNPWH
ncbi:malonate decarboxylase holo-ACP synthase [Acinetobacter sp. NIPH 2100]|uniref:malonate decarboxylase holo-ACP synthase n=1 Tax=Acinetobacter sp. NIPH 2100 TaxID=1217708 RepID=UPI0002CEE9F3|nr:malonate decarboxylase holo-ACP synthase [Acinetobacter sp. NIPH 2100]ENX41387.1 malonate decarboxylase holo-[acyl-carrier-protein] synthase [Acinetobacter sp. NIPH 2100]